MNPLILNTSVMNDCYKTPLLKLISAQTTACYKPCKIRVFLRDFDQEYRQNHWIQQMQRKSVGSRSDTDKSQVWTYLDSYKESLLRHLRTNRAALLLLLLVVSMNSICRGNKTESRTSAGSVQIRAQQQNCSWLSRITMVEGIPGRGKENEKDIQTPGDELPGQGGSVTQGRAPCPAWAPIWETGESQHCASCKG